MPRTGVENGISDAVERLPPFIAEPYAHRIGPAVADDWLAHFHAVHDGSCVLGDLLRCESEACSELWVDLKIRRRTAYGIVDSVLNVDHSINLLDFIGDAGAQFIQ